MRKLRLRREDGQVLVLFALALPLLFGIMALVLDASNLMVQRSSIQNAADAAVLAAAQDLSGGFDSGCTSDPLCVAALRVTTANNAAAYSAKNSGPSALGQCVTAADTNCYSWPYKSDNGRVEVRLRKSVATSIASAVGMGSHFYVSARAVGSTRAIMTPGKALSIFAYAHHGADPCGSPYGVTVNGNPQTSIDGVLSNGTVTMNTTGAVVDAGYGPPPKNCPKSGSNQSNAATWYHEPALLDWPRTFDRAAICSGHDSAAQRNLDNPADGIYCSTVGIKLTGIGSGKTYHLTLVAPVVTIPGTSNHFALFPDNADLDASNQDLIIWQYGAGQDLSFNHNNSSVNGVIWIENGNLNYVGNSGATGFYEAQNVTIDGNSYVMHGTGRGPDLFAGATVGLAE
jgi:type II secretory pathway pseudopilin PulG